MKAGRVTLTFKVLVIVLLLVVIGEQGCAIAELRRQNKMMEHTTEALFSLLPQETKERILRERLAH